MTDSFDARVRRASDVLGAPDPYIQDGLVTFHNHDFMTEPAFMAAYRRGVLAASGRDYGWHWRVHIGLWAARTAVRLPGDFVECGVNAGFMSSCIMQALDWNRREKTFYLLDTFAGIDERFISDQERNEGILDKNQAMIDSGFYVLDFEAVKRNFSEWHRVELVKGSIPDTLSAIASTQIAFLHIDLNCAPPEVAALKGLWDRLVPGAIVLLDDYAFAGYQAQKSAMDQAASDLGVAIASLPTGQGLLIRPPTPASRSLLSRVARAFK